MSANGSAFGEEANLAEILSRQNTLLADLVEGQGTADLPETTDVIPYGTISVPDNRQYIGMPSGRSTFNFADGEVTHEDEGKLADIQSIRGLSRSLDSTMEKLRSAYIYMDAPGQVSFDGDNTRTAEAGQHYTFTDAGFSKITVESDYCYDISLAAGTRRTMVDVASSGGHFERVGARGSGQYPGYTHIYTATPNLWDQFGGDPGQVSETMRDVADIGMYTRPYENVTIMVENQSGDTDIDVRIVARDIREKWATTMPFTPEYTVAEVEQLSDRHKFTIAEPHHELRVEFRGGDGTQFTQAAFTAIGVS